MAVTVAHDEPLSLPINQSVGCSGVDIAKT